MAECNISIDQNKLPGVKEVCKDFAVLEDHCLAYNLQEQEIESHLASNVHKSRLVQKDLQVAKRLQEEEDERSQKQHIDIERQDNEIAQEIQEKLVRQAEQQRQRQEEEDAAIARKLQEKEKIREERRRQKQQDANIKEDYYEDHGASRFRDVDRHQKTQSLGRYDAYSPVRSHQDDSSEYYSTEPKKSRYPRQDSAAPHGRSRYPEHYLLEEGGRNKHADPYPEHLLPSRGKHEDRYPEFEPAHMARDERGRDADREMRRKERPARPPPPKTAVERGEVMDREKHKYDRERDYNWDKHVEKDYRRDREQDLRPAREREKSRDRQPSGDGQGERDRQRQKDKERKKARSRDRGFEEDYSEPGRTRERPRDSRASWEEEEEIEGERRARSRQRVQSNPVDVFDEFMKDKGRGDVRERLEEGEAPGWERSYSHSSRETGRVVHKGSGAVIAEKEYGLNEATRELTKLDLREQELKDMEVARKLQEEELKASNMHARAAQVAKDEELARRMMELDKKEYKKNREREKEKERERVAMDRMAVDKRRQEANYRPNSEEVVRPRTREEYEYQRQRTDNKPARPPQPRAHDYENVNSGYGYPEHLAPSRPPARPEAAYRGAYHKR